jgi:molybdopterin-binding protein
LIFVRAAKQRLEAKALGQRTGEQRRSTQMKISARNVFEGKITDIKKGATTSHVTLDVKGLHFIASITNEAVEELGLKVGGKAEAVVKSSDVLIAV